MRPVMMTARPVPRPVRIPIVAPASSISVVKMWEVDGVDPSTGKAGNFLVVVVVVVVVV